MNPHSRLLRPSGAFIGASWGSLAISMGAYLIGLWNSQMALNEKGFYLAVLILGLFAAISLQKTVRDRVEDIPVTGLYMGLCWSALASALVLLVVGLINATMDFSVKGFFAMAYFFSLFAVVTIQKNVRDTALVGDANENEGAPEYSSTGNRD